jgi:hypothetical protein
MVAVHQRQLLSWEEDRQKVLTLEERCSKLEGQRYIQQHLLCTSVWQHVERARGDLLSWGLVSLKIGLMTLLIATFTN